MRVKDGVLYIDASELEKAIFCNRVPKGENVCKGAGQCTYDGGEKDFTKCEYYQNFSEYFSLLKQRVAEDIDIFNSDTKRPDDVFFYCPMFKAGLGAFIEPGEYKVEPVAEK